MKTRFITISLCRVNGEMVILFSMYKLKIEGQVRIIFVALLVWYYIFIRKCKNCIHTNQS